MINQILSNKVFKEKPLVLLDLGAGGDPKTDWDNFYQYSNIFKLDANDNIKNIKSKDNHINIKEIIYTKKTKLNFNITNSIFCSSLLIPNKNELQNWVFNPKFKIKKQIKVKTKTIKEIIREKKIKYIDWIKLDLQGIDLKIFKSIPKKLRENIFVAEFEPGLYNFYKEEDKLSDILDFMEKDYLVEDFTFSSSIRVNHSFFNSLGFWKKKSLNIINKKSKFYSNISFLKKNNILPKKDKRSILLMLAILILKKRFIEALELIKKNQKIDPIMNVIEDEILKKIRYGVFLYFLSRPYYFFKKMLFS